MSDLRPAASSLGPFPCSAVTPLKRPVRKERPEAKGSRELWPLRVREAKK